MIIGHYASTLVPYSRINSAPLWLLLVAANLPDAGWLALAATGFEPTTPLSMWDATFLTISVDMLYSHDLLPALGWIAAGALLGYSVTRNKNGALWCAFLVAGHFTLDLLCGFEHHIAGPSTPAVGLNFYHTAPYLALAIEGVFCAAMVLFYSGAEAKSGRALTRNKQIALYALFVGGALMWLPTAEVSLGEWLNIHP